MIFELMVLNTFPRIIKRLNKFLTRQFKRFDRTFEDFSEIFYHFPKLFEEAMQKSERFPEC